MILAKRYVQLDHFSLSFGLSFQESLVLLPSMILPSGLIGMFTVIPDSRAVSSLLGR